MQRAVFELAVWSEREFLQFRADRAGSELDPAEAFDFDGTGRHGHRADQAHAVLARVGLGLLEGSAELAARRQKLRSVPGGISGWAKSAQRDLPDAERAEKLEGFAGSRAIFLGQ